MNFDVIKPFLLLILLKYFVFTSSPNNNFSLKMAFLQFFGNHFEKSEMWKYVCFVYFDEAKLFQT